MIPVTVGSIKKNGPYSLSRDIAAKTLISRLSLSCSNWLMRIFTAPDSYIASIHSSRQMERHLITEDQLVHNRVIISQSSQEAATEVILLTLCLWVSVVAASVIDMDGHEGASEELATQLFSVRQVPYRHAAQICADYALTTVKWFQHAVHSQTVCRCICLYTHTHQSVTKRLYHARTDGWLGGLFPYVRRNSLHCNNRFRFMKR
jgi:hypothetical protein